jgi:predicted DNA-binding protein
METPMVARKVARNEAVLWSVTIDEVDVAELETVCRKTGRSGAYIVYEAISDYLAKLRHRAAKAG